MKVNNIKFYLPKRTINEATDYYCNLIERAFTSCGYKVFRVASLDEIKKDDLTIIIRPRDLLGLKAKVVFTWFQGIGPEEFAMVNGNGIKSFLGSRILTYFEKKALTQSLLSIFVSDSMVAHFETKYKTRAANKIIIPCYNKNIDSAFFMNKSRYQKLSFVYAGGLAAWQCIDETLLIFKEVQKLNPEAELTLLTGERNKAEELIQKYGIDNVFIDYAPLEKLQDKLSNYKYGFLVRQNNVVNNVATPTKMNSYLACGLIPVYTNVIDDFEKNIDLGSFGLKFSAQEAPDHVAAKIISHHAFEIDAKNLFRAYQILFDKYYNDEFYIRELSSKIKKIIV